MGISSKIFYPDDVSRARGDNVGTIFGYPAPQNLRGRKNLQNPARFLTTFNFDREYLRNGTTNRKSKTYVINYNPSHVGRKKAGELWSTNAKVIDVDTDPPTCTFFGRLYFRPWGVLRPHFFTRALD